MCDTFVATPERTQGGAMLFGKNSDRQRNEAQVIEIIPRAEHAEGASLKCTYIAIPQARRTYAVLLCRPFWLWGAEMGANEHGVVIGNEGLFARVPAPEKEALIGMDLLRLALERAACAEEAIKVITQVLEQYGQGGNCGHLTPAHYHNSFLIADRSEAYVLETVEREWLVKRVRGTEAISNHYSIASDALRKSSGLDALLAGVETQSAAGDSYADRIADPTRAHIGSACERRARAIALLDRDRGAISARTAFAALRDHDPTGAEDRGWHPAQVVKYSLCIHAGTENRDCQTTGSLVSDIRSRGAIHWVTATAAPCISVFKPLFIDGPLPRQNLAPSGQFNSDALWWRHEQMHRAALLGDFQQFLDEIRDERDALEAKFVKRIEAVFDSGDTAERRHIVEQCWTDALELENRWQQRFKAGEIRDGTPFSDAWQKMSRVAGMIS